MERAQDGSRWGREVLAAIFAKEVLAAIFAKEVLAAIFAKEVLAAIFAKEVLARRGCGCCRAALLKKITQKY
jgi:hypothetical protein